MINNVNDWIVSLLEHSNLLESKQALICCAKAGTSPIVIDNYSSLEDLDEVLVNRVQALNESSGNEHDRYLLYSTIELLNNLRSGHYSHFISAVIAIEGGRFLLYASPDKKSLLGCIFNASSKIRPEFFERISIDHFPKIKDKPKKTFNWLSVVFIILLIIYIWPYGARQITQFLDKPCIENVKKEAFNDAIIVCLKRMEQGSRSAAYLVGKLHQDGLGVKIDFDKAEKIYNQLADEKDKVSALAYLGLADLYKSEQFDKKNYSKSAQFYKLSADLGLADSQLQYGLILFVGRGIEKNEQQAIEYLQQSAKGGNKLAKGMLPILSDETARGQLSKQLEERLNGLVE
ncbi:Sel1 repeat-containing protein [Nitrosomonas marina]|uniref:Sel1 repeat-containing protein n=1 Tax=Nitrosomonas marina TaxID=917 RepID=A0A1I0FQG6_9PROT|nr:tetratricopeptide repeat protein [Nitrosomonas marina]SET59839.1 Sel1 repeat-containing protein [Nitrosomonas marina]